MANASRHLQTKLPKQIGEVGRLKVVQGPDKGVVFVLTGARITLGRGEENDVMFSDLKSSRKHAEMMVDPAGGWAVRDLGSSNGIVHNGTVTRAATLKSGDTLAIGETVFEFIAGSAGTRTMMAPPKAVAQDYAFPAVAKATSAVRTGYMPGEINLNSAAATTSGLDGLFKNKRALAIVAVGVVAWIFLDEPVKAPGVKKQKIEEASRDLASYLPAYDPSAKLNSAEMFFREGFREYREKNYLRAKTQFETALQIAPGHRLATLYLKHCEKSIEEEVKFHLEQGRKGMISGKLKESKGHFESVMRLMYRDQAAPHYIEAQDQWKSVDLKMKGGSSG